MQVLLDWNAWGNKNPRNGMGIEVFESPNTFLAWADVRTRVERYVREMYPHAFVESVAVEDEDGYLLVYEDEDASDPIATIR